MTNDVPRTIEEANAKRDKAFEDARVAYQSATRDAWEKYFAAVKPFKDEWENTYKPHFAAMQDAEVKARLVWAEDVGRIRHEQEHVDGVEGQEQESKEATPGQEGQTQMDLKDGEA